MLFRSKRLNGAKAADYLSAGYNYVPRGGPFQTIDELKLVMGITPELFRQLEPIITVYSQRQALNIQTAPWAALLSSPGMSVPLAEALIQARNAAEPSTAGAGPILGGVIDPSVQMGGWPFTIRVEVPLTTDRLVRDVTVRLTGDQSRPFWILASRSAEK